MALSVIARARPWGVRGRSSIPHHPNRCLHNKIRWCGGHRSTVAAAVLTRNPLLLCATSNSSCCAADKPATTLLHDVRSRWPSMEKESWPEARQHGLEERTRLAARKEARYLPGKASSRTRASGVARSREERRENMGWCESTYVRYYYCTTNIHTTSASHRKYRIASGYLSVHTAQSRYNYSKNTLHSLEYYTVASVYKRLSRTRTHATFTLPRLRCHLPPSSARPACAWWPAARSRAPRSSPASSPVGAGW